MYLYFRKEIDLCRDIELLQLINYHQKASMLQSTPHQHTHQTVREIIQLVPSL